MNPQSPREELEIRITALLMGELSSDEAAALQAQIAADAELTALHARLQRAMGLLREANAIPEQPAPPVPARLSDARRAWLLAHFQGAKPEPVIVKPQRDWRRDFKWAVPLGLAASLMALIGGAMFVNGFGLRRESAKFAFARDDRDGDSVSGRSGDALKSGVMRLVTSPGSVLGVDWYDDPTAKLGENGRADSEHFGGTTWDTPRVQKEFDPSARGEGDVGGVSGARPSGSSGVKTFGRPRVAANEPGWAGAVYLPSSPGKPSEGMPSVPSTPTPAGQIATANSLATNSELARQAQGLSEKTIREVSNPLRGIAVEGMDKGAFGLSPSGGAVAAPALRVQRSLEITAPIAKAEMLGRIESEAVDLPKSQTTAGRGSTMGEGGGKPLVLDPSVASGTADGLTKTGSGTIVLSGTSHYTGGTTITGGVLQAEGSGIL